MIRHSKHQPAERRRASAVEAVVALAARQNPGDITTAAIAERVGVTQAALFKHFPTKESILEAVMEWVAEQLLARVAQAAEAAPSPLAALEAAFLAHVAFVAAHPRVPRMLFGELQRTETTGAKRLARTLVRRYGELLHGLVERGRAAGEISPAIDTNAAVTLFVGSVQGLVMQSLLAGSVALLRREAPGVFNVFRRALLPSS